MSIIDNVIVRETFGIFASVLVLISMTIKSDNRSGNIKMRLINLLGCIFFILYGAWIRSISTIFLNVICLVIHFYFLVKLFRNKD